MGGIKLLDPSRKLAEPICTQFLGDSGADVIKINARPRALIIRIPEPSPL